MTMTAVSSSSSNRSSINTNHHQTRRIPTAHPSMVQELVIPSIVLNKASLVDSKQIRARIQLRNHPMMDRSNKARKNISGKMKGT
jgi:hypothetical protein